jgi:hypothetical protein
LTVIIDELKYAQSLLKNKQSKIQSLDLAILAKYFRSEGDKPSLIKKKLSEYCRRTQKHWNEVSGADMIKRALRSAEKYRLQIPTKVFITKQELDNIAGANDYIKEKILFVLLAYAKFRKYGNLKIKPTTKPMQIGLFYSSLSQRDLFALAKMNICKSERLRILHELQADGFIEERVYHNRRTGSYSTRLLKYANEVSPVEVIIEDVENFVLYYQRYKGEKVIACECGRLFVKTGRNHRMCSDCWKQKRKEQIRVSTKKWREKRFQCEHF